MLFKRIDKCYTWRRVCLHSQVVGAALRRIFCCLSELSSTHTWAACGRKPCQGRKRVDIPNHVYTNHIFVGWECMSVLATRKSGYLQHIRYTFDHVPVRDYIATGKSNDILPKVRPHVYTRTENETDWVYSQMLLQSYI